MTVAWLASRPPAWLGDPCTALAVPWPCHSSANANSARRLPTMACASSFQPSCEQAPLRLMVPGILRPNPYGCYILLLLLLDHCSGAPPVVRRLMQPAHPHQSASKLHVQLYTGRDSAVLHPLSAPPPCAPLTRASSTSSPPSLSLKRHSGRSVLIYGDPTSTSGAPAARII